jgi:sphinganine-1-phosphate aldolase
MSIKTHRDKFRAEKGITEPEWYLKLKLSIAPTSVHAAVDKGCHYFGVKLIKVPVDLKTGKANVKAMEAAITGNTILLFGSTPSFPHGAIDDIAGLSELALKYNTGLHVDSCLGGFLVPFMAKAGYPLPEICDFRLEGVSSISVDTHKYGFAPKGSSVVLYKSKELRAYQYFGTHT